MFQFKLFSSGDYGDNLSIMQYKINDWFTTHHPDIRFMSQSTSGHRVHISFVFSKGEALDVAVGEAVTAVPEVYKRITDDLTLDPDKPRE